MASGHAPPWTAAQVRLLNARHAFAVGHQHRGAVPTSFRICPITEPDLPAAGNRLTAQHSDRLVVSVPDTGRREDDPTLITFSALPGLLTHCTLAAKTDPERKFASGRLGD